MSEWTVHEVTAEEARLKLAAETLLGQAIFEFGHLEMELALFLVWADDGAQLTELTKQVSEDVLHARLCQLDKRAKAKYGSNLRALQAFNTWLKAAHAARVRRNEFVHGRWGVAATERQVVNVVGLPTSEQQREIRYSLSQLEATVAGFRSLRPQLRQLRAKWPL